MDEKEGNAGDGEERLRVRLGDLKGGVHTGVGTKRVVWVAREALGRISSLAL
jgi:hypothetical protein